MSFADPILLIALLLVPLAVLAQVIALRSARRHAVRFTAIPALKLAVGAVPAWRRHLPAALAVAALATLALALAKPQRSVAVPLERASIMLVTDHSRSMLATDVDPDRLAAGKAGARSFLDEVPSRVRVGVVTFSDTPDAVHAPSTEHDRVREVIDAAGGRRRHRHGRCAPGCARHAAPGPPRRQPHPGGDRAAVRRQDHGRP